ADVRYVPAESLLVATLDVDDRAGGVLASLAGLPADAALSVKLDGKGALDDWRATLRAQGGAAMNANGTATLRRDGVWRRGTVRLETQLGAIGPSTWRGVTEGQTVLTFDGALSDAGAIKIGDLHLVSPALQLNGSGVFDPTAKIAVGSAVLTVQDGARLSPLIGENIGWHDLKATAHLKGAWPKPALDIEAQATRLIADDVSADQVFLTAHAVPDRQSDRAGLRLALSADAQISGVTSSDATLQRVLGSSVALKALSAAEDFETFSNLSFVVRSAGGEARFLGDLNKDALKGEVSIDVPDLQYAGLQGGSVSLRTLINADRASALWQADGTGHLRDVKTGDERVNGLLQGANELTYAFSGAGFDRVRGSNIALTGAHMTLLAQGDLTNDMLDLNADIVVPEMSALGSDMSGRAKAKIALAGPLDALHVGGSATFGGGTLFGEASQSLALSLGTPDAKGFSGFSLTGDLAGRKLTATAGLSWADKTEIKIDRAQLAFGTIKLAGDVSLTRDGLARGELAVSAGDLQDIASLIDVDVAGGVAGKVVLSAPAQRQQGDVVLTSAQARIDTARMSGAAISGKLFDPFGALALDLRAQSPSVDIDGFALTRVDATAKGRLGALDVSVKGLRQATEVSAQGRLDVDEKPTRIALNALSLVRGDKQARLATPVALMIASGAVAIPTARIEAGGGRVIIWGTAGREMNLSLVTERLPLWVAEFVADPLPVAGLASGTIRLSGHASDRQSEFDLKVVNLTPRDTREVARNLTLAATGTTDRGGVSFKSTLSDPRGTTIRASGRVPFGDAGALAVEAQGEADLALANVYLGATGDRARGRLSVAAKVTGTLAAPRVNGSGSVKDGLFRSAQAGLELRDIVAQFEGSEWRIVLTSLTATAPNGGAVKGHGEVRLDRAAGFPIDLAVTAANAQLVASDLTTVTAALDTRMVGALLRNPVVRGTADIERWDIRVPERLARPLTPIAVTHRNAPAGFVEEPAMEVSDSAFTFGLDLDVRAPRQVFVRGQGIDAEFGGKVKVSGTVDDPVVRGRFDLRRGSISLLSERVSLTKGSVIFSGDIEPVLDISGSVRKNSITATIAAKGKASDPQIVLSSSPTLPQDEILARLLFSKGTQQLSAFEAAQLAQAIGKWSGLATGPDILDRLRSLLGIDALSATTDEKGSTAVSAGSYVGSGVFVGLSQGAGTTSGGATVEVEITDDIKVRGEAQASGNTKVGVAAEWEY
ncbi:MAG: translocation/assembly module TamB domain-containing protein, partial [Alphaproteobacteria bacterium]|nr:translocation/assembly module TamB domain-containing protein [Alphaproteobacteria bacterium]